MEHSGIEAVAWMFHRLNGEEAVFTKNEGSAEENIFVSTANLLVESIVMADELAAKEGRGPQAAVAALLEPPPVTGAEVLAGAGTGAGEPAPAAEPAAPAGPKNRQALMLAALAVIILGSAGWLALRLLGGGEKPLPAPGKAAANVSSSVPKPAVRKPFPPAFYRKLDAEWCGPGAVWSWREAGQFRQMRALREHAACETLAARSDQRLLAAWGGMRWGLARGAMAEARALELRREWDAAAAAWSRARAQLGRAAAAVEAQVEDLYQNAMAEAGKLFGEKKWAAAESGFLKVLALPGKSGDPMAMQGLQQSRYRKDMEGAETAFAAGNWERVRQFALSALAQQPGSAPARLLLDRASAELQPRFELSVTAGGRASASAEVSINGGRQVMKLPAVCATEVGKRYWLRVELPPDGDRCYPVYETVLDVRQPGKMVVQVKLEPLALPKEGALWLVPGAGLELKPVPAGKFRMGRAGKKLDEEPVHDVVISRPFWMGRTEVTNGQYRRFLKETGYKGGEKPGPSYLQHFSGRKSDMPDDDNCPVCYVSWEQASAFCRWLTARERAAGRLPGGYVYRLPTEAEWEYACRAGTAGDFAGPVEDMAWYSLTALDHRNRPVATRFPNAWGLCDMHGNVWEWCGDWLGDYPAGEVKDPVGPEKGLFKVMRGGSWENAADMCRSANRGSLPAPEASPNLGFRVVLGIEHGVEGGKP